MESTKPRYIWIRLSLIAGALLGLLLLVQSIVGYIYVSRRLVVAELEKESHQQVRFLRRHARETGASDLPQLSELLDEVRRESGGKIAWIRMLNPGGEVLLQTGGPDETAFALQQLRLFQEDRNQFSQERNTAAGEVLATVHFFGPPPPPGPAGEGRFEPSDTRQGGRLDPRRSPNRALQSPNMRFLELAMSFDGAAAVFKPLRRNLVVACLAALALVVSMGLLLLRFPLYVRGKQLEEQLAVARQVQENLLPTNFPSEAKLDIAAECHPAYQVGGDFYDIFDVDHQRVALLLGDVSGKGLPSALLMGLLHGAVRSSRWINGSFAHEKSSTQLNDLLCSRTAPERFASLFWCYYDPEQEVLRYVNAGHLPPYVIRRSSNSGNGGPQSSELLEVERLREGGPVLGILPGVRYRQGQVIFRAGDLLVLYSDGVIEARNSLDEEFGEDRLLSVIEENIRRSPNEIRDEILHALRSFLGSKPPLDDVTLLLVRCGSYARDEVVHAALHKTSQPLPLM